MKYSNILHRFSHTAACLRAAFIFCLLVMLSLASVAIRAQTPDASPEVVVTMPKAVERAQQEGVTGKSIVRGRAVYDDTNRPVRRARVLLLETNNHGPERTGMTNNSGEFQIKNVPAGNYFVMVDATGIITPISFMDLEEVGGEKMNLEEIKKHFDEVVVDGTSNVTIKVRARRGGAISGKITYADGDAAINVRVSIMRKKEGHITRFITNMNPTALFGVQTDDRGMYRVAGLPPGEYVVSASEMADHTEGRGGGSDDLMGMNMFGGNSLLVTYYQSATKASSASVIKVEAGQEQNEINITLAERELHALSGTVVARRDSSPLRGARVSIKSKDDTSPGLFFASALGTETDEQGRFTFNEIPNGAYTLTVEPPYTGEDVMIDPDGEEEEPPAPPPVPSTTPKRKYTRKQQDVTVADSDITDLTITLTEGAIVSGTVTVEGGRPLPSSIIIALEALNGEDFASEKAEADADGKFTINGLSSGAYYPNLFVPPGDKYYLKAMTAGGVEMTRDPLAISEGVEINNVRVVISPDAATLAGRVISANNTPVSGANFVLIPADQSRWRARASFRYATSEGDGGYSVSGAPGEYLIIFLRAADSPRGINEAWIRDRATSAQHVTLLPQERKSMNLLMPAQ